MTKDQLAIKSLLHLHPFRVHSSGHIHLASASNSFKLNRINFDRLVQIDPRITKTTIGGLTFTGRTNQSIISLKIEGNHFYLLCSGLGDKIKHYKESVRFIQFLMGKL